MFINKECKIIGNIIDFDIKERMVVFTEKEQICGHLQPVFQTLAIIAFTLINEAFTISP